MKKIYFDLIGGASGDMLLASLVELGCPLSYLEKELSSLKLDFSLKKKRIPLGHHKGLKLIISSSQEYNLTYREIQTLLESSSLKEEVKKKAQRAYEKIFLVEKRIHKIGTDDFKFHNLGRLDAILEITGFYLGLDYLQIEEIYTSVFSLSLPSPATLELLKGKKIRPRQLDYESITPTAAVLLKEGIQEELSLTLDKYGVGVGEFKDYLIGYLIKLDDYETDTIIKIETNIDDINPQIFDALFDVLYKQGAKEVYIEQVIMKKSRPGFVLHLLCDKKDKEKLTQILFRYTTTFGIRYREFFRKRIKYQFCYKETPWGKIKFRIGLTPYKKEIPEYEDCKKIAQKFHLPLLEVYQRISS